MAGPAVAAPSRCLLRTGRAFGGWPKPPAPGGPAGREALGAVPLSAARSTFGEEFPNSSGICEAFGNVRRGFSGLSHVPVSQWPARPRRGAPARLSALGQEPASDTPAVSRCSSFFFKQGRPVKRRVTLFELTSASLQCQERFEFLQLLGAVVGRAPPLPAEMRRCPGGAGSGQNFTGAFATAPSRCDSAVSTSSALRARVYFTELCTSQVTVTEEVTMFQCIVFENIV